NGNEIGLAGSDTRFERKRAIGDDCEVVRGIILHDEPSAAADQTGHRAADRERRGRIGPRARAGARTGARTGTRAGTCAGTTAEGRVATLMGAAHKKGSNAEESHQANAFYCHLRKHVNRSSDL